jgi:ubiquinone/menaquinone biosynthesis C-methylase UbiE
VDAVLSNCVINLVPDKRRAFAEIYRVLRSGGRFSISDMVTYGDVPAELRQDMELWAGCIAGAVDRDEYLGLIKQAGFSEIKIFNSTEYGSQKGDAFGLVSLTLGARKL